MVDPQIPEDKTISGYLIVAPVDFPLPFKVIKTSLPTATNLNQTSRVLELFQHDGTE
jgi:hypothetical protein